MGGFTGRILNRSGWLDAEGRIESDILDVKDCWGLVIIIDGIDPYGVVWIEEPFRYPRNVERYAGTSKIVINTRYVNKCRLTIYGTGSYRYQYGFMNFWLMSDEEMKPAYDRFCGYNADESYDKRCATY